jgi:hypothetical protein
MATHRHPPACDFRYTLICFRTHAFTGTEAQALGRERVTCPVCGYEDEACNFSVHVEYAPMSRN